MEQQIIVFCLRWLVSSTGMWLCLNLFGHIAPEINTPWLYLAAGLIFSFINSIVKPLVLTLSLPLIILSLGLFTALVNIAMIALVVKFLPHVEMTFCGAALSAFLMSIINSIANFAIPNYNK